MRRTPRGFTLIELVIVVAILGVLAALAIPGFILYIRRAKASEATSNLNLMFKNASAFYSTERTSQGILAATVTSCVVASSPISPASPSEDKQKFTATPSFHELGFTVADYVYFGYGIQSITSSSGVTCLNGAENTPNVYTMFAHGNLDGDGVLSTFELAVGTDSADVLYHARGFYISKEIE